MYIVFLSNFIGLQFHKSVVSLVFFERQFKELINGERKYQIEFFLVFIVTFTLAIMTHIFVCVIPPPQYENEQVIVPPHVLADLHKFLASLI